MLGNNLLLYYIINYEYFRRKEKIAENFPLDKLNAIFKDIIEKIPLNEKKRNNLNEDINVLLSREANGGNINIPSNHELIYKDIIRSLINVHILVTIKRKI